MGTRSFPAGDGALVYQPAGPSGALLAKTGSYVTIYTDEAATAVATGLMYPDGSPVVDGRLLVNATSRLPRFLDPTGRLVLYSKPDGSSVVTALYADSEEFIAQADAKFLPAIVIAAADSFSVAQDKLDTAPSTGARVALGPGLHARDIPLLYDNRHRFGGAGMLHTVVRHLGDPGTFAFQHRFTADGSAQWPGRVSFQDMTILGDGTGTKGAGATVGGIFCGDDTTTLVNIPWYSLRRVRFRRLASGLRLEGYGHHLEEVDAYECGVGYDLTHPEQAMLLNCWANYCETGVEVNVRQQAYGHKFHIIGGAYQRCTTGMRLWNLYEPVIDTYFELNNVNDIVFGDPANPGDYVKGCKNVKVDVQASSAASDANIALHATVGAKIKFHNYSGTASAVPHVKSTGFSKYIDVEYNPEGVNSTNPWDFQGSSAQRAIARVVGGVELPKTPTITATDVTASSSAPPRFYKTDLDTVVIEGALVAGTAPTSNLFTLPVGYRPAYPHTLTVPMYTTSWGTAVIEVRANGTVVWLNGVGASRTLFLGSLRFRTSAAGNY